jgi:predicted RNA-binding protein associated with RNAse of E/G family
MVVHLIKSARRTTVSYVATPLTVSPNYALVRAQWTRPAVDLGYMQFAPGDILDEHFYADQWYSIFAVYQSDGQLRGWYCNVSHPAIITATTIHSHDLELDLFVSADRQHLQRLDIDEYEAQQYQIHDPATYQAGWAALAKLEALAQSGQAPFDIKERL